MLYALVIFNIPFIFGFRLLFDTPSRGGFAPKLPPDLPRADATEQETSYLPGFLTEFQSCIIPELECPSENITFWFYTRETRDDPVQIDVSEPESFRKMSPVKGKSWIFLSHGYTGYRDYAPNPEIRSAYFDHGEYNIISVDYGKLVFAPCYYAAVKNVPLVANCSAQLLDALISEMYFDLKELHVIGFSLGAHVAGHLHLFLKAGTIPRITGLDPAMPLFLSRAAVGKLDVTDAEFVDVIHTNAGQRGMWHRAGHVDFYVNGGYSQPNCSEAEYGSVSSCNHGRAVKCYAESISSQKGFWAVPCGSAVTFFWGWCPANETNQVLMGEYTPNTARGTYYLETEGSPPYAMGKIPVSNSSSEDE